MTKQIEQREKEAFAEFEALARKLVSVPKKEIIRREKEEKQRKAKKKS